MIKLYESEVEQLTVGCEDVERTVKETDIDRARRKLLAEGEKALAISDKSEDLAISHEHFELQGKLAKVAPDLNDFKKARIFTEAILREPKNTVDYSVEKAAKFTSAIHVRAHCGVKAT